MNLRTNALESNGEEAKVFKWNSEYKDLCYNALIVNSDNLKSTLENIDIASHENMDTCVNNFTECFTNIMSPFFKKKIKSPFDI
jgi:hypothetical protein